MLSDIGEHQVTQFFLSYILLPLLVGIVSAVVTTKIYDLRLSKARQDSASAITGQYRQMVQSVDLIIYHLIQTLPLSILDDDKVRFLEMETSEFELFKTKFQERRIEITTLYSSISVLLNDYMNYKKTENFRVLNECAFIMHCILEFFETLTRYDSDRAADSPYIDKDLMIETDLSELIAGIFGYRLMADWKIKDKKRVEKSLHGSENRINNHYFDFIIIFLKAVGYYDQEVDETETHEGVFPIIFLPAPLNLESSLAAAIEARETEGD